MSEQNGRFAIVDDPDLQPEKLRPVSVADLRRSHPNMRPAVVQGILRVGETANIIAPPKAGKSFLAGNLAWCVATGRSWLGHAVEQGRVLVLDNELHSETLAHRLTDIADKMEIRLEDRNQVDVISMRGQLTQIGMLALRTQIEPGQYALIVLDALYRTLPPGTSENDNADMMAIYNELDALAEQWRAAIVVIHHSSKGAQGDKALTDVGAGAGAISRAADTHIAIRPHETEGHHVLEAVTRSFKSPEPVSISFTWPLWSATELAPQVKRFGGREAAAKARADAAARDQILAKIPTFPQRVQQKILRGLFGFGVGRFGRLVGGLASEGAVRVIRETAGKRELVFYSRVASGSGSDSGSDSGMS